VGYRYLLFARFALVNIVAAALLVAAYLQGWLDGILAAHLVELSGLICLVFAYGLALCGFRVWRISRDLNMLKAGDVDPDSQVGRYLLDAGSVSTESRALRADALRLTLTDRIVSVRHLSNGLIFLGLVGTVIGFIVALSGVDPAKASQVENITAMVATLVSGMSVALYTTLVGAVFYIWLAINYRLLVSGTVDLIATTIELGEQRART
jgi:hypothetical protein